MHPLLKRLDLKIDRLFMEPVSFALKVPFYISAVLITLATLNGSYRFIVVPLGSFVVGKISERSKITESTPTIQPEAPAPSVVEASKPSAANAATMVKVATSSVPAAPGVQSRPLPTPDPVAPRVTYPAPASLASPSIAENRYYNWGATFDQPEKVEALKELLLTEGAVAANKLQPGEIDEGHYYFHVLVPDASFAKVLKKVQQLNFPDFWMEEVSSQKRERKDFKRVLFRLKI